MKVCSLCKIEKENNLFKKDKRREDGCSSHCKECCKKAGLEYYYRTKDIRSEDINKNRLKYYQNNKESENLKSREYKKNNKEKIKKYNKEYRENNKEKIKLLCKKYKENNSDKVREYTKNYIFPKIKCGKKYSIRASKTDYGIKDISTVLKKENGKTN